MYSKIVLAAFAFVSVQALPLEKHHQATSFVSFNQNHNTVHHVHSAPGLATPVHAVPIHAVPVAVKSVAPLASTHHNSPLGYVDTPAIKIVAPVAVQSAPVAAHSAPVPVQHAHHEEKKYAPAKYDFAYGIEDHHTGDIHSHKESRDGDHTQGEYSLHEADGTIRTVKYTVDKHSGFNAVVERSGHAVHSQPASHH